MSYFQSNRHARARHSPLHVHVVWYLFRYVCISISGTSVVTWRCAEGESVLIHPLGLGGPCAASTTKSFRHNIEATRSTTLSHRLILHRLRHETTHERHESYRVPGGNANAHAHACMHTYGSNITTTITFRKKTFLSRNFLKVMNDQKL